MIPSYLPKISRLIGWTNEFDFLNHISRMDDRIPWLRRFRLICFVWRSDEFRSYCSSHAAIPPPHPTPVHHTRATFLCSCVAAARACSVSLAARLACSSVVRGKPMSSLLSVPSLNQPLILSICYCVSVLWTRICVLGEPGCWSGAARLRGEAR